MHTSHINLTELSLSQPSFSEQSRLPEQFEDTEFPVNPNASIDHNFKGTDGFILSPLVTPMPSENGFEETDRIYS